MTAAVALRRLSGLPRSAFGTALAHIGLGVTLIGIVAVTAFETEHIVEMKPGMTTEAGGYTLRFDGMRSGNGPNYTEESRSFHHQPGRRRRGRCLVVEADLYRAADADDRGRYPHLRLQPALRFARR